MDSKHLTALAALLTAASLLWADDQTHKAPRAMNYFPDNGEIVCINGNNRYTRALYGSHTRMRLETSDRPVFATYDRDKSVNIAFLVSNGERLQPLATKEAGGATPLATTRGAAGRRTSPPLPPTQRRVPSGASTPKVSVTRQHSTPSCATWPRKR